MYWVSIAFHTAHYTEYDFIRKRGKQCAIARTNARQHIFYRSNEMCARHRESLAQLFYRDGKIPKI